MAVYKLDGMDDLDDQIQNLDEDDPSDQNHYENTSNPDMNTKKEEKGQEQNRKEKWDAFNTDGANQMSTSERKYDKSLKTKYKLLKFLSIIVVFCLTLAAGVVSKGATFFMVSQLSNDVTITACQKEFTTQLGSQIINTVSPTATERVGWFWAIFFCFLAGELFTLIRSFRVVFMKSCRFLSVFSEFPIVFIFETLHVVGTSVLFLVALPELDSFRAIMVTQAVAMFPCILKLINKDIFCHASKDDTDGKEKQKNGNPVTRGLHKIANNKIVFYGMGFLSLLIQLSPILWFADADVRNNKNLWWSLAVGLLLTSFGWWECYVQDVKEGEEADNLLERINEKLASIRDKMSKGGGNKKLFDRNFKIPFTGIPIQIYGSENENTPARGPTYFFISIWKIGIFLTFMSCLPRTTGLPIFGWNTLYSNFIQAFENNEYFINGDPSLIMLEPLSRWEKLWESQTFVIVVQICSSWILYSLCKFSCKSNIEQLGFALPMTLITPVSLWTLTPLCVNRNKDPCAYSSSFPKYLYFSCPTTMSGTEWLFTNDFSFVGIILLLTLSLIWITAQIWHAHEKGLLLETDQVFSKYYYNGLLVDTSLMLNKKHDPRRIKRNDKEADEEKNKSTKREEPTIYACATMWHESDEEIKVCLKSMFKMDDDYCVRHLRAGQKDGIRDDLYEWEGHIFFDDAMTNMKTVNALKAEADKKKKGKTAKKKLTPEEKKAAKKAKEEKEKKDEKKVVVNDYVLQLIKTVKEYGEEWYGKVGCDFGAPKKILTPYGGKLEWTLPGGTKLVAHLKNKNIIRNKKRWSQIMYMYYFLGYKLKEMDGKEETDRGTVEQDISGKNTFLLALDGDVDFLPDAVIKVVDILEKNDKIGAACGRIHPTGGGYMTWYQKFEYAIGHWLQKSTEHVLGCVLCSPGCFSLFRGQALMNDNVMRTYATKSELPQHYIQYDQGEDRWLCTLMLKQGWRVEYAAASDSYTACPQGFGEFYNQRRRWMPSTMLNVIDLLGDWNSVVKANDDISSPYMFYQGFNLVGSVIGPGSILLMLIGAFALAFGLSSSTSLILNLVLIGIFIAACVFMGKNEQIMIAQLLTFLYAIIMIAVYIGIIIQIIDDGPLSLSALGFFFTFGSFIVAAMFHPQEWTDLFCCVVYVATIPSMYLLLTVFAVFNMNDVSWGTREAPKVKDDDEEEEKEEEKPKKKEGFLGLFQSLFDKGTSGFSKVFSQMSERDHGVEKRLDKIETILNEIKDPNKKTNENKKDDEKKDKNENNNNESNDADEDTEEKKKKKKERNMEYNKFWVSEENIKENRGQKYSDVNKFLTEKIKPEECSNKEKHFWEKLIEKYLEPIEETNESVEKKKKDLLDYKNKVALGFVIVNAMWVTAIYMLQAYTMVLGMKWPLGAKGPTLQFDTSNPEEATKIILVYEYLRLEPVGLVFVVSFIFVIILQSVGMVFHCVETLEQIIAHTDIRKEKNNRKEQDVMSPLDLLENMREKYADEMRKYEESKEQRRKAENKKKYIQYKLPEWAKKEDEVNKDAVDGAQTQKPKTMQKKIELFLKAEYPDMVLPV